MAPIEKQDNIFEKMLILKYTFKTGVFSRFFLLFSLPLKIGVFYLKIVECPERVHLLLIMAPDGLIKTDESFLKKQSVLKLSAYVPRYIFSRDKEKKLN
jgi:hypothetical protein